MNRLIALASLCFFLVLGCQRAAGPEGALAAINDRNIKRLCNLYAAFQLEREWVGPRDEGDFKAFMQQKGPEAMRRIGVDLNRLDDLLKSERDGERFQIRWGLKSQARGPSVPVVFETKGVDGKFEVGFTGGEVLLVDRAEYDELLSGQRDPKASAGNPDVGARRPETEAGR